MGGARRHGNVSGEAAWRGQQALGTWIFPNPPDG